MIEQALNRLGKKKCGNCRKINDKESKVCKKCGQGFTETSTPEDGL